MHGGYANFYSRPCGRGDAKPFAIAMLVPLFLLTPLREGRPSLHFAIMPSAEFLLTPLREGRHCLQTI